MMRSIDILINSDWLEHMMYHTGTSIYISGDEHLFGKQVISFNCTNHTFLYMT